MKKLFLVISIIFINLSITKSQINVVANTNTPNLYDLYEITFDLTTLSQSYVNNYLTSGSGGINPYDYTQIETYALLTSPSGKQVKTIGFYYEGQTKIDNGLPNSGEVITPNGLKKWKVRFTPNEIGKWTCIVYVKDIVHSSLINSTPLIFNCNGISSNIRNQKGFIRLANNRYLKYETGQPYYPLGSSCTFFGGDYWEPVEYGTNKIKNQIDGMKLNGMNFFRFEINMFSNLNLYGPDYSDKTISRDMSKIYYDQFNQHDSWQLDNIIGYANANEVNIWLALFAHSTFGANGNYSTKTIIAKDTFCNNIGMKYTDPDDNTVTNIMTGNCGNNPYSHCNWAKVNPFNYYMESGHVKKSNNRGTCPSPYDFFGTNTGTIKVQNNLLKYVVARWGYSPNILAFELMDEANIKQFNLLDNYPHYIPTPSNFDALYVAWNGRMYDTLKSIDKNNHLVTSAPFLPALPGTPYAPINAKMDFTQSHNYFAGQLAYPNPEVLYYNEAKSHLDGFNKPFIVGETGYWGIDSIDPKAYETHNMLWGTFFNGSFSSASVWEFTDQSDKNVLNVYKGISNFSKELPQFSSSHNANLLSSTTSNGLRSHYLKSNNGYQLYGWIQDKAYEYLNMFNAGYLKSFPTTKPPLLSTLNNVLNLSVSKNATYEIRWYNTITGNFTVENKTAISGNLTLSIPTTLLSSTYSDAAFTASCKPTKGWVETQTCPSQWNSVLTNSTITVNDIDAVFYINTNRQICGFWKQGNDINWLDAISILPTYKKVLAGNTSLLWSSINNCIYYVGEDSKIYKLYFSGGLWQCQQASPSQWNSVLSTSLITEASDGSLLYVNVNNEICTLYLSGNSLFDGIISTTKKALNGKAITNKLNTSETYYVGQDQKIWKVYYNNGWQNQQVSLSQWNLVSPDSKVMVGNGNIYYVNTSGNLCLLYLVSGVYYDGIINNNINVKLGTQLTFDPTNNNVYFIGSDNNIYKAYYSNAWIYEKLNQSGFCQEVANGSLTYSTATGNLYYSGLNDNMIHQFTYNSTYGSLRPKNNSLSKTNSNSNLILDNIDSTKYSVYPNPISKFNKKLYIDIPSKDFLNFNIYNSLGELIQNGVSINNEFDLSNLNSGFYCIIIKKNDDLIGSYKIIIEQ